MFKKPVYLALFVLINLGFLLTTYEGRTQGVINLPQTGQTKCYNASRTEIACSGTGQDGELQTGVDWPDPRFAVSGDCVTDNLTGLMWAKNGNLPNGIKTWQGALDYVASINYGSGLCGQKDWRLPSVNELESLVNSGEANIANWLISHGFSNVQPSYYYWSSTTTAGSTDSAYTVNMLYSTVEDVAKSYDRNTYVWLVRSGQGSLTIGNQCTSSGECVKCGDTCIPHRQWSRYCADPTVEYECECSDGNCKAKSSWDYSVISIVPTSLTPGNTKTIQIEVKNIGSATIPNLWFGLDIHAPSGVKVENTKTPIADSETGHIGLIDFGSAQGQDLAPGATRTFTATYTFSTSVTGHVYAPGNYSYKYIAWAGGYPGQAGAVSIGDLQVTQLTINGSPPTLVVSPYLPASYASEVKQNNVAIRHYTVQENGQTLKGQFATVSIHGQEYVTPWQWQRAPEEDVGGVDLPKYADSDTLWVAVDTKSLNLAPGEYTGQIKKIGNRVLNTPVSFTIKVLEEPTRECYFGHSWGAEVSFGEQIGVSIKGIVALEAGAAVYVGGEDLLYFRTPNPGTVYLERHRFLEGGEKLEGEAGLLGGKLSIVHAEAKTGLKPSSIKKFHYNLMEGLSSKAAFAAEVLDHLTLVPITAFTAIALRALGQKDYTYEENINLEAFISWEVSLGPSFDMKGPRKGVEETISLKLLDIGFETFLEAGGGWNYEDNEDWKYVRFQFPLLELGGIFSFNAPALGFGLYRYNQNGVFDRYRVETWTSQDLSTFWEWNVNESAIDFPVKSNQIEVRSPRSLIDHLYNELSKYNGFLDYEKKYEKENDVEIGFGLKFGFGLDVSTKFAARVSSDVERGTFSVEKNNYYPFERGQIPSVTCALDEIKENVIIPAIDAVKDTIFQKTEIVEQKAIEIANTRANAAIRIISKYPVNATRSYWAGSWGE